MGGDAPVGSGGVLALFPPEIIHPDASAIIERAKGNLLTLRTIDCVTEPQASGGADSGVRYRIQLRFDKSDAMSMPLFRITKLTKGADGEVAGPAAIFDGRKGVLVDDRDRSYFDPGTEWRQFLMGYMVELPRWYISERSAAIVKARTGRGLGPTAPALAGARLLKSEQFAGVDCDVVELYWIQAVKSANDAGVEEVIDENRYTETIHYARTDGMPRKVEFRPLVAGDGAAAATRVTTYEKVVINEGLEREFFSTNPPEGYAKKAQP